MLYNNPEYVIKFIIESLKTEDTVFNKVRVEGDWRKRPTYL